MTTIRRRILLTLLPFTTLALTLTALWLHRAVEQDLTRALDARLLTLAGDVAGAVEMKVGGMVEFDRGAVRAQFGRGSEGAYYSVRTITGNTISATDGAEPGAVPPEEVAEPIFRNSGSGPGSVPVRSCIASYWIETEKDEDDIEEWLAENPGKELPPFGEYLFWIEVAVPQTELSEPLAGFRARLAVGFGVLLFALVLVPVLLVGRGLRPLRTLSHEAELLGVENLDARLTEDGVDEEVKSLVSALNRSLDRVTAAYDHQKRFTADVAHELRSPLASLSTRCDVTLRKPRDSQELRAALESVRGTTKRLSSLVENLLALSRYECDAVPQEDRIDLAEAARSAARLITVPAEARGVQVDVDLPEPIAAAGNPVLLQECLAIFLENAVRFSPKGGEVRIEGGSDPSPWIAVNDEGPGIAEEDLSKIFERFYQVDPARSPNGTENGRGKGYGLGLSIAKEIARLHDAEIDVTSEVGVGSRFEIRVGKARRVAESTPISK